MTTFTKAAPRLVTVVQYYILHSINSVGKGSKLVLQGPDWKEERNPNRTFLEIWLQSDLNTSGFCYNWLPDTRPVHFLRILKLFLKLFVKGGLEPSKEAARVSSVISIGLHRNSFIKCEVLLAELMSCNILKRWNDRTARKAPSSYGKAGKHSRLEQTLEKSWG